MKYLLLAIMFLSMKANANCCEPVKTTCCNNTKIVYRTDRQMKKQAELEKQLADLRAENEALKIEAAKKARPVHIVEERVEVRKVVKNKSAFSLIGGGSKTDLKTEQNGSTFKAKTAYEPDLGLMFQHDFKDVRGSVAATVQGSLLLGIGIAF